MVWAMNGLFPKGLQSQISRCRELLLLPEEMVWEWEVLNGWMPSGMSL